MVNWSFLAIECKFSNAIQRRYTDHIMLTFNDITDNSCQVDGCSESQVFSILDFSTNYCNIRQLLCGAKDGCKVAGKDLAGVETHIGDCTQHDKGKCIHTVKLIMSLKSSVRVKLTFLQLL